MKIGEIINVGLKPTAPYAFVAIAKKAAPKPTPLPGSSCSTVSPNSRKACCKNKTLNGSVDKWCAANYPDTNRIVAGTVVKVINANRVQIKYTKPDKKVVIMTTVKKAHNMKIGEIINVGLKPAAPYVFVAIAKKN